MMRHLSRRNMRPSGILLLKLLLAACSVSKSPSTSQAPPSFFYLLFTMASKIGTKTSKKWLADPSTYPLIACIGAGAVMCFSVGVRHLTKSPDVKWNREVRKNPELALRDRSDWMSHRGDFKSLASNRVNTHEK